MLSRRRRNSSRNALTGSCVPARAATAAFCVTDVMFDVVWPSIVLKTRVSSFGAMVQPHRQPVIEYALEAEHARTVRSRWRSKSAFGRLCGTSS